MVYQEPAYIIFYLWYSSSFICWQWTTVYVPVWIVYKKQGIVHITSAPYKPSSNGQAKRFDETVKNGLLAMEEEKVYLSNRLQEFLMQIRKAPNSTG